MVRKLILSISALLLTVMHLQAKSGEKPPITIRNEIIVHSSIEKAWMVLGPGFENAYKWAASVDKSEALDSTIFQGSSCTSRGCEVAGFGYLKEKLLSYSNSQHSLRYDVSNMPKMIKSAILTWQLVDNDNGTCTLVTTTEMKTGGFMGTLMKGMLKKKMGKLNKKTNEEFAYYVENNEMPHPRKVKSQNKYNKKNKSK